MQPYGSHNLYDLHMIKYKKDYPSKKTHHENKF